MKSFLKYTFATIIGILISFFILGIVLVITFIGISSSMTKNETKVSENSILELNIDYPISERSQENFGDLFAGVNANQQIGLEDLLNIIKNAENDSKIKGILLKTGLAENGLATISEIRNALKSFKSKGKFIYATANYYDKKNYYLSAVADSIFIEKTGNILLNGFSTNVMFYAGALEKLGVEMQYVKVGTYKGAVESFTRTNLSDENKEQITSFLSVLYQNFISDISADRKIDATLLKESMDNFTIQSIDEAIKIGLIDKTIYLDELKVNIAKRLKIKNVENLSFVKGSSYKKEYTHSGSDDEIAVIFASGEIMDGEGNDNTIGGVSLSKTISKARLNKNIKAIVLRVNSPGGSALASDIICREIALCKGQKPVIVSMGDVAASGGYYISALADSIIAMPNTITGSIGVFGLFPNAQKLINDKIGLKIESVNLGKYADFGRLDRPLQEVEKMFLQKMVNSIYEDFTNVVEKGRKIDSVSVEKIAQGRVWAAAQAKNNGLIDSYGGLNDAIKIAAFKSKLKNYNIVSLPKVENPFEKLFNQSSNQIMEKKLSNELGVFYTHYKNLTQTIKVIGFQTRLPFNIQIP